MAFAVMQTSAKQPAPQQMRDAYRGVPGVTAVDADRLCQELTPGILARGLLAGQASALQAGLSAQGIAAEVVDETTLPALPPAKTLRRIEITPAALVVYDPLNRAIPIDWRHVALIAAGNVQQAAFERTRKEEVQERIEFHGMVPVKVREVKVNYSTLETQNKSWLAGLLLAGGTARFSIEAGNFQYACLGNLATREVGADFRMLVRELWSHAPGAALNSGAHGLLAEPPVVAPYVRQRSLETEMTWWLWKQKRLVAA